ncbi:oligosaccharide flippase family protein [Paenarthrobacter ureafaciens]|uniref:oligosaccharide flippase family protein n=1 Tax=Paenarthrobacter ureafaciens TaxID=37931 RepID=UPI0022651708|nr:oligosaccharide flippase family protein [Paenarthrobacter ureafaciens]MCX8453883.1 oligosaccharide flippase family protein [Paenarthrobacter ureafaciens]MCY0971880.1 oligosaccharide flippase family protein [Paenarthrobacter ureafaciens]
MTLSKQSATRGRPTPSKAFGLGVINAFVTRLGTIGIGIALARLLGPAEFGTYAVAFVALIAVLSFNELGVSLAIVRWPGDPKAIAATVTTISTGCSVILFAATYFAAPYFASAMGNPAATDVVRVMAACIVLNGLVATPAALLQRYFRQGQRMAVDQVNVWLGAGVSLALVIAGMGAMSLAVGRVAASVVSGILFVAFSPLPFRFGFSAKSAKELLLFGLPLAGASLVAFGVGYVDQFVAGNMLGSVTLGLYVMAFNMAGWPAALLSQPLRSVAPATFARLQDRPEDMRAALLSLLGVLSAVLLPVCAVMMGCSVALVTFVYGDAWAPAGLALVWLAPLAALRIIHELLYDYLVVLGLSMSIFNVQAAALVALIPALIAGAAWGGMPGLAAAPFAVAVAVTTPMYLRTLRRAGVRTKDMAGRLALPVGAAVVTGAGSFLAAQELRSPVVAVLAGSGIGLVAIVATLAFKRAELRDVRRWGRGREEAMA